MKLAGALLAAIAALYATAVGWAQGRRIDATARAVDAHITFPGRVLGQAVELLGWATMLAASLVLLGLARRRGLDRALAVAALLIGANLSAHLLKAGLGRADLLGGEMQRAYGRAYFPSGHATAAMSLALASMLAVPRSLRTAAIAVGAAYVAAVGAGNLVLHAHTPADDLGGILLATAWASAIVAILGRPRPSLRRERPGNRRKLIAAAAWGCTAVAGVVIAAALSDRSLSNSIPVAEAALIQAALVLGLLLVVRRRLDALDGSPAPQDHG